MHKLNFPVIKESLPRPPSLSMDDYLKFVRKNFEYFFDRKSYEYWKKKRAVNVPFSLK